VLRTRIACRSNPLPAENRLPRQFSANHETNFPKNPVRAGALTGTPWMWVIDPSALSFLLIPRLPAEERDRVPTALQEPGLLGLPLFFWQTAQVLLARRSQSAAFRSPGPSRQAPGNHPGCYTPSWISNDGCRKERRPKYGPFFRSVTSLGVFTLQAISVCPALPSGHSFRAISRDLPAGVPGARQGRAISPGRI